MVRPKDPSKLKRKQISLPEVLWENVEILRFELRCKTEAEVIRKIIEAGVAALNQQKDKTNG